MELFPSLPNPPLVLASHPHLDGDDDDGDDDDEGDDDDGHDGECDYDYHYDGNGGDD